MELELWLSIRLNEMISSISVWSVKTLRFCPVINSLGMFSSGRVVTTCGDTVSDIISYHVLTDADFVFQLGESIKLCHSP